MEVGQQLAGPGGGLPVDVLHGVTPGVLPQTGKLKGVVQELFPAEDRPHDPGVGQLHLRRPSGLRQDVQGGCLRKAGAEILPEEQILQQEAGLVHPEEATAHTLQVQAAGDTLPRPQDEHVPTVGLVADGGIAAVGKAEAAVQVKVHLGHRKGQQLVVDQHFQEGDGIPLRGVFGPEGQGAVQPPGPTAAVGGAQSQNQQEQDPGANEEQHVNGPTARWGAPRTGAGSPLRPAGRGLPRPPRTDGGPARALPRL